MSNRKFFYGDMVVLKSKVHYPRHRTQRNYIRSPDRPWAYQLEEYSELQSRVFMWG